MDLASISPATESDCDVIWSEVMESRWYVMKGERGAAMELMAQTCEKYHVTPSQLREKLSEMAEDRQGKEDYLPRIHTVISHISTDRSDSGPWIRWRKIPDCPWCVEGLSYAAWYEDDRLKSGQHIWCQCNKALKNPMYHALNFKYWSEVESLQKSHDIKIIPKDSEQFYQDVRKVLTKPVAIRWHKQLGEQEIPIPF